MKLEDFDYLLPAELIAQRPVSPRDASRLMVLDRQTGQADHKHFYNLGDELEAGDVLVLNNTKVIPARLYGIKDTGAQIEVVLLKALDKDSYQALVKPGRRVKKGAKISFGQGQLTCVCQDIDETSGGRILKFSYQGVFEEILDRIGLMPLPPYITEELKEADRYQTVYAKTRGSAAAPTAGLHFTPKLMEDLRKKGVIFAEVMLHVGLGTFRPVSEERIEDHHMHKEYYEIDEKTAQLLSRAKAEGRRIIAVGTTSVRTLESVYRDKGGFAAHKAETDIFIYPGYDFKAVDAMVTNFHLPKSTLLMLVSAFMGRDKALAAYRLAVKEGYRFFSFGDAMMIR